MSSTSSETQQLLTKATALYHSGDYQQAIQVWQEILAQEPKNQRAIEGIRMASLLLEEAQSGAAGEVAEESAAPESPEVIAKVREGIQKVRSFLASARYLDAMEVCHALLQLAPRSEAVREVLEDARDAYEAQPFIDEHLEIARQLFVQERLDEAMGEIQKILFLSANHGEAKKLEAKIESLRQKQNPPDSTPEPQAVGTTRMIEMPPDFGEGPDLSPQPPPGQEPDTPSSTAQAVPLAGSEPVLNEDWESELAQLNLGPAPSEPQPSEAAGHGDPIPLTDLPEAAGAAEPASPPQPATLTDELLPDLDPAPLGAGAADAARRSSPKPRSRTVEKSLERGKLPARAPALSVPLGKIVLGMMALLVLSAGGWWLLGDRSANASGQGGGEQAPPPSQAPLGRRSTPPGSASPSNVGLSSNTSRPGNTTPAQVSDASQPGGATSPSPPAPLPPEEMHRQVASLFAAGRAQIQHNAYEAAAATFSKILDLDPANIEAKEQLDQAASKVQEQRKLEEDLQAAKQFFVEKDYESALRKFYRLPKDRNLGEVDLFIRNAWFNWAVVSMKGGNCIEALQRLDEDLNLHPDDEEAVKLREVADHYRDRPKDKVFYAYVDRLTYRTLNQK